MKHEVKIVKTLITDNGKEFSVGADIAYRTKGSDKKYIGRIKDIGADALILDNVEAKNTNPSSNRRTTFLDGDVTVRFEDIVDGSCGYVYYD